VLRTRGSGLSRLGLRRAISRPPARLSREPPTPGHPAWAAETSSAFRDDPAHEPFVRIRVAFTLAALARDLLAGGHLSYRNRVAAQGSSSRDATAGERFRRRTYVAFALSHPYFRHGRRALLTRWFGASRGRGFLVTEHGEYFCDGEFLGSAFERDSKGVACRAFATTP